MATYITEHFTLEELTASATARQKGIKNEPNAVQTVHLCRLAIDILEPFRLVWGDAIDVTSGFRGFQLSGSSSTSVHPDGYAADLQPRDKNRIREFKQAFRDWLHTAHIAYDQYIDETRNGSEWVHIGHFNKSGKQRRQDLITKDGKTYNLLPRWVGASE